MGTSKPDEVTWTQDLLDMLQEVLNYLKTADISAKDICHQDSESKIREPIQRAEVLLLKAYTLTVEQLAGEMATKIDTIKEEENSGENHP